MVSDLGRLRWRWAPPRRGVRLARGWPGVALVSFAASVLSWPARPWERVYSGLDPSWEAGLAMGFMRDIQWGPSLVFTFGPYGFTDYILNFYHLTAFISVVFALTITWGLAALIVTALRRTWGLLAAGLAAWAACVIASITMGYSDLAAGTVLALALAALRTEDVRHRLVLQSLLAGLAGFELLDKFNTGLVSVGALVLIVAFVGGRRLQASLVAGASLLGVALAAWLGAGQSLSNLVSYIRGTVSVAAGYGAAMQLTPPGREVWLAVVMAGLLCAVFAVALRDRPRREQAATVLLLSGWGWAIVKEGFVRAPGHDAFFFALVLVAFCIVRVKESLVPFQGAAVALAALVALYSAGASPVGGLPNELHWPTASVSAFVNDVVTTLLPGRFAHAQAAARAEFLSTGGTLPPATLSLLEGHTVAVEPTEDSVMYTYPQLNWDPEPVLQGYSAYTTYLDHLNAGFLASSRAPQRILYQAGWVIDDRDPYFDPPATLTSMYCHYVQIAASGSSQVLARVPDRCGPAVLIAHATAHFGQAIIVPHVPGKLLLATFKLTAPLPGRIMGLLLRSPLTQVSTWTESPSPTTYRFLPGTAEDDHVVGAPTTLGYSPTFTPPTVHRITLLGDGWRPGEGDVRVTFYAMSLSRL